MATFETWTVLPHEPIEKLEDNLWRVEGKMPDGKTQRAMVVARLADGRLIIHNAIALDEPEMKQLEAFGTPAALVVPNGFHRQDAKIWKARYPELRVYCPPGSRKRVSKVVTVDGDYTAAPSDGTVRLRHLRSMKGNEGVLEVRSGDRVSLAFNDALCNMPALSGLPGFFLAPTGRPSVPRVMRWLAMSNKADAVAELNELSALPGLARVMVGHGKTIERDAAGALRGAASAL